MPELQGQRCVQFWVPVDELQAADRIAHQREISRAAYLRSLMAADRAQQQGQREAAAS